MSELRRAEEAAAKGSNSMHSMRGARFEALDEEDDIIGDDNNDNGQFHGNGHGAAVEESHRLNALVFGTVAAIALLGLSPRRCCAERNRHSFLCEEQCNSRRGSPCGAFLAASTDAADAATSQAAATSAPTTSVPSISISIPIPAYAAAAIAIATTRATTAAVGARDNHLGGDASLL
jgi:hypothetical protein